MLRQLKIINLYNAFLFMLCGSLLRLGDIWNSWTRSVLFNAYSSDHSYHCHMQVEVLEIHRQFSAPVICHYSPSGETLPKSKVGFFKSDGWCQLSKMYTSLVEVQSNLDSESTSTYLTSVSKHLYLEVRLVLPTSLNSALGKHLSLPFLYHPSIYSPP